MRVLISSTYYWPELAGNAPYVTGVAEHWASEGHAVEVLAGLPHYPEWRKQEASLDSLISGVRVIRYLHHVPAAPTLVKRTRYEASLFFRGLRALRGASRPDVVVGFSPSLASARIATSAAGRFGVPLVLIIQDVLARSVRQSGLSSGRMVASALEALEGDAMRRATAIGVVAAGFKNAVVGYGVEPAKVVRLRNWSTLSRGSVTERTHLRSAQGWSDDDLVCVYAGSMGAKQGLEVLVDAAARVGDAEGFKFVLAGDGGARAGLEFRAKKIKSIEFLPSQTERGYADLLSAADVLLLTQRSSVVDMSLPSKLATYFEAGRPIVAAVSVDSEAAHEIRASGSGLIVAPGDARALVEALGRLRVDPSRQAELGAAGRSWAAALFDREKVFYAYDRILEALSPDEEFAIDQRYERLRALVALSRSSSRRKSPRAESH